MDFDILADPCVKKKKKKKRIRIRIRKYQIFGKHIEHEGDGDAHCG